MVSEHDPAVAEYQHEKSRPREAEALHMLRKIASLVKPIMRQRGWRVGVLTEFYPEERNLLGLNINKGERICLRLRYAGDERQFMPLEQVTDTMLHELCHIVHGPHDEPFHNLWNQLRDEYENLIRKGYTGEGFLSAGHKVGGGRIPMHEARRRARAAAEKRKALSVGSGQKLGGAPTRRGQDIRQVIADAAAKRAIVTKGCASGTTKEREREIVEGTNKRGVRTKAEEDDANEEAIMIAYIDLVQEEERQKYGDAYIPPSEKNPAGSRGGPVGKTKAEEVAAAELSLLKAEQKARNPIPPVPNSTKPNINTPYASITKSNPSAATIDLTNPALAPTPTSWTCAICTLVNPHTYLFCDACGIERPSPSPPPIGLLPRAVRSTPSSIRDSNAVKAVRTLRELDDMEKRKPQKPLGWLCQRCGQFMEQEWWTCANCGEMKTSS
ncbi:MAG: hypothetical protein Q9217_005040 [Psora testacea]